MKYYFYNSINLLSGYLNDLLEDRSSVVFLPLYFEHQTQLLIYSIYRVMLSKLTHQETGKQETQLRFKSGFKTVDLRYGKGL